jgi:hypothetical protein
VPDLSVVADSCHQGYFSFKNGRHVHTLHHLRVFAVKRRGCGSSPCRSP